MGDTALTVGQRVIAMDCLGIGPRAGYRYVGGTIEYISPRGWATVMLDFGYRECFWLEELEPVEEAAPWESCGNALYAP